MSRWIRVFAIAVTGAFVAYYGFSTGTPVNVAVAEKGKIRTYVEKRVKMRLPEIYRVTMPLNRRI